MNIFVIADTHFCHKNIIKYCNRPYNNVEDMNEDLINRWNKLIRDEDIVFHLGDVGLGSKSKIKENVSRLNGRKILIMGNHDNFKEKEYLDMGFESVSKYPIIYDNFIIMSHEPMQLSNTTPYFNLYGHVHNDPRYIDTETSKCVSVERIDYMPLQIREDGKYMNLI